MSVKPCQLELSMCVCVCVCVENTASKAQRVPTQQSQRRRRCVSTGAGRVPQHLHARWRTRHIACLIAALVRAVPQTLQATECTRQTTPTQHWCELVEAALTRSRVTAARAHSRNRDHDNSDDYRGSFRSGPRQPGRDREPTRFAEFATYRVAATQPPARSGRLAGFE